MLPSYDFGNLSIITFDCIGRTVNYITQNSRWIFSGYGMVYNSVVYPTITDHYRKECIYRIM